MITEVEKVLKEKGDLIEKEIEKVIPREGIRNLNDAIWYHLDSGGKRIRPVLAILTCESLGGDLRKVIPFAAACEILHNWLLVHDDIEDGDRTRRNKPAVWVKYGLAHGVNVGDFMSEKVYEIIINSDLDETTKLRLIQEIVETCEKTAEGQALDMNLRKNNDPSEEEYMEMIELKTAWYLTLPMVGGAIIAGKPELTDKIREFGMKVGPAFQMADDLLDLTKGKGRGETGSDIREGKRSIMAVHCSSNCDPKEKKKLFEILNEPREKTSKKDVIFVKKLFEKHHSLDYAKNKAKSLVEESKMITKGMPENLRRILDQFAEYLVERKN
ncbi:MAG: polyprenyl synthetase family protein [Candidatus Aenigmatarchaeota archaeon]|nr:MAG: polyprenyl synthetase family protein [Candidatus Aenigmarchaeota archaeon]